MRLLKHRFLNAAGEGGEGGGATSPATQAAATSSVDVDAIRQTALTEAQTAFAEQLKAATGFASFDELKAEKLKADGKLQELADTKDQEASAYKAKYEQSLINNALLSAATNAVYPEDIVTFLAGKGAVDASGRVTIDGKSAAEAVSALLAAKPLWAKPAGTGGSGSPSGAEANKRVNHAENQTEQLIGLALLQQARTGE